jgi:mannose-1-phosphate guanylyltransferase
VLGKLTLLEETCARAALEFAPQRTLYVVNRIHEPYYGPILGDAPASNLIAQPSNRGTAPAILYSLLRIAVVNPNAVVGFLPSDHYVPAMNGLCCMFAGRWKLPAAGAI